MPRMVTHQPKDGHPPTQGWSPTKRKCTTDLVFGTHIISLTKLTPQVTTAMDGHLPSLAGLPTNPRMVIHQPKDSHPQEGSVIPTCNLSLYSQNERQVTTAMDGHLPSLGGSPTNPRMVSHQPKDGHPQEGSVLKTSNLRLTLY